ncbi:MAG: hypothetical protein JW910_01600 [Anaerolineae bacterium]|nr:hypothetical protein [Anaerolineae bacterium]
MTWTTPRTWAVDELVTAANMNTHLRDNLSYLFARPLDSVRDTGTYATTSTSFVDVSASNLIVTLTITSGRALVLASFSSYVPNTAATGAFDVIVDSTTRAGDSTWGSQVIKQFAAAAPGFPTAFVALFTGLSAGSHTFKLQYKTNNATYAVNLCGANYPIWFVVMEV